MADGTLRFDTKIDNTNVAKDIKDLERKIRSAQESIGKSTNAKLPLEKQLKGVNAEIREGQKNLQILKEELAAAKEATMPGASPDDYIRAKQEIPGLEAAIADQEKSLTALQKKWDTVNSKVDGYNNKIAQAKAEIAQNREQIAMLGREAGKATKKTTHLFDSASKSSQKLGKRILNLAKRAFLFSVITSFFRKVRDYVSSIFKTNKEYTSQLAKLKGALITAFQPIYEWALPGVIALLKVLTKIVQVVATVLSALSGKTIEQTKANAEALYDEAKAIDEVGASAKKAQKSLAGFDEINKLTRDESGGAGSDSISADFSDWDLDASSGLLQYAQELGSAISSIFDVFAQRKGDLKEIAENLQQIHAYLEPILFPFQSMGTDGLTATIDAIIGALHGLTEFLLGAFTGDWERAFSGLGEICESFGGWVETIFGGLQLTQSDYIDWLHNFFRQDWVYLFGPILGKPIEKFFKFCDEQLSALEEVFAGFISFISGTFSGDWQTACNGIKSVFKGMINGIISLLNQMLSGAITGLNKLMKTLSFDIDLPGGKSYSVTLPSNFKAPQIPLLAKGAVLPANKPFLAMVGDQRNGTNVEAPLSTIQEAVAMVMGDMTGGMMAGFEANQSVLMKILQAIYDIDTSDERYAQAVDNFNKKMAVVKGG